MIDKTKLFPFIMIVLNLAAAGVYLYDGDFRKTCYWLAAAVLNITVTV